MISKRIYYRLSKIVQTTIFILLLIYITSLFFTSIPKYAYNIIMIFLHALLLVNFGRTIGDLRGLFKSGILFKIFYIFAGFTAVVITANIYAVSVKIDILELSIIDYVKINILLTPLLLVGFFLTYQHYAIEIGSKIFLCGLSFYAFIFPVLLLIFCLTITGFPYEDTNIIFIFISSLFICGFLLGDSFSNESKIKIYLIIFEPYIIFCIFYLMYATTSWDDFIKNIYINKTVWDIFITTYNIVLFPIIMILPQLLGYKIASRRRRDAIKSEIL